MTHAIVDHGDGPARVAGDLGTGKTTMLRRRSERLQATGARVLELRPPDMPTFAAWWEGVDWGDWAPRTELGRLLWSRPPPPCPAPSSRRPWPPPPRTSG